MCIYALSAHGKIARITFVGRKATKKNMFIKQISVFMENKPGQLKRITGLLKNEKIDVRAFSISDTVEFGILRLIVNDSVRGAELLRGAGFTAQLNDVLVAVMKDKVGALDEIVTHLGNENIDVIYMYSFIGEIAATGRVALYTDDMEKAYGVLKENGIEISETI